MIPFFTLVYLYTKFTKYIVLHKNIIQEFENIGFNFSPFHFVRFSEEYYYIHVPNLVFYYQEIDPIVDFVRFEKLYTKQELFNHDFKKSKYRLRVEHQ